MGAWGTGNFENDAAYQWLNEWLATAERDSLEQVFDHVLNQRAFLDSPESCAALVAAELLAARLGQASADFPSDLDADADLSFLVDADLREAATRAVNHILYVAGHSELRALWQEAGADEFRQWEAVVNDLLERPR